MTDIDRLLAIIGAETPIAALSLADTWRAEKQGYMEYVAELQAEIQTRAIKDAEDMHRLQAHCAGLYEQLAMADEIIGALIKWSSLPQFAINEEHKSAIVAARAWLRREVL